MDGYGDECSSSTYLGRGNRLDRTWSTGIMNSAGLVYTFVVDWPQSPREIDLFAAGKPVGKGIYQFDRTGLVLAVSLDGKMIDAASIRQAEAVVRKAELIGAPTGTANAG